MPTPPPLRPLHCIRPHAAASPRSWSCRKPVFIFMVLIISVNILNCKCCLVTTIAYGFGQCFFTMHTNILWLLYMNIFNDTWKKKKVVDFLLVLPSYCWFLGGFFGSVFRFIFSSRFVSLDWL